MGGFEKVLTALGILLVLILVLYLSYICTRYVGKRARGVGFGGGAQHIIHDKLFPHAFQPPHLVDEGFHDDDGTFRVGRRLMTTP